MSMEAADVFADAYSFAPKTTTVAGITLLGATVAVGAAVDEGVGDAVGSSSGCFLR